MIIGRTFLLAWSAALTLGLAAPAARADVTIIGALSNFDVRNQTNEVCDEFEFELEGPQLSNCYGTWGNYNYGPGVVTALPSGLGIKVNYKRVGHTTNVGTIEHFGVHLNNFGLITSRVFRWKHNGVVVTSGPGQVPVPIPTTVIVPTPTGEVVVETIENESPETSIWVRRSTIAVPREVALAELMPNDPLVLSATPLEVAFERLGPGETLVSDEPVDPSDYVGSLVIVVETFSDIATWNAATQSYTHVAGTLVSRVMNATVVQSTACANLPVLTLQPQSASGALDGGVEFNALAVPPDGPGGILGGDINYQWRHEGVDMEGEDTGRLRVDPLGIADSGNYTCVITNDCGRIETAAVQLTVTTQPDCPADFTGDGHLDSGDYLAFLLAFAGGNSIADRDGSGEIDSADYLTFLLDFASGC